MKKLLLFLAMAFVFAGVVGCDDATKPATGGGGTGGGATGEPKGMPSPPALPPPPK